MASMSLSSFKLELLSWFSLETHKSASPPPLVSPPPAAPLSSRLPPPDTVLVLHCFFLNTLLLFLFCLSWIVVIVILRLRYRIIYTLEHTERTRGKSVGWFTRHTATGGLEGGGSWRVCLAGLERPSDSRKTTVEKRDVEEPNSSRLRVPVGQSGRPAVVCSSASWKCLVHQFHKT